MDPTPNAATDPAVDPSIDTAIDLDSFACPRCGTDTAATFYGPCDACRDELRLSQRSDRAEGDAPDYEPKMNVTPNAVALKE